jgi:hypothetical protein
MAIHIRRHLADALITVAWWGGMAVTVGLLFMIAGAIG